MQKRDYSTRSYNDYTIPNDWRCPLYTDHMDMEINCTSCGRNLKFGDCYTSKEIHNHSGLWYPVCDGCYQKEIARQKLENKSQ